MVLLPRKGRLYWFVTDIWETFVAVPVVVEYTKKLGLSCQCSVKIVAIDTAEHVDYDDQVYNAPKSMLYINLKPARLAADKMNGINDANDMSDISDINNINDINDISDIRDINARANI